MALREVVTHPAPVLRGKAHRVTDFGDDLQTLIDDMIETMRAAPGVGLAAPQVDVPARVIVVEYAEDDEEDAEPKLYAVVNPEIIRPSRDKVIGTEGCLSIPGFVGDVERPVSVTVKGQNRNGKNIKVKANGWLARIFQHEVDHLNGVLFIDLAEKVYRLEEEPAEVAAAD